jgi:hypothetical protein
VTNSQTIHIRKKLDESPAERQEDLRQVQGDSPARSCDGDLRESAAQAAARLTATTARPIKLRASVLREQLPNLKSVIANSGRSPRIHPRSEAEAPVIGSLYLIKGSRGRITPDTSAMAYAPSTASGRMTVDQTKGSTA